MTTIDVNIAMPGFPPTYREGELIDPKDVEIAQDTALFKLKDGTELEIKTILLQLVKFPDFKDAEGNPIYHIQSQNIVKVKKSSNTECQKN